MNDRNCKIISKYSTTFCPKTHLASKATKCKHNSTKKNKLIEIAKKIQNSSWNQLNIFSNKYSIQNSKMIEKMTAVATIIVCAELNKKA